jgi:predicted nucleotidyltransferase
MASELTRAELQAYRRAAQLRERQRQPDTEARRTRAWTLARQAAELLKKRFGVRRVVVFGSLARGGCFTRWSDVDLAAWGLRPEHTFQAMGLAWELDDEIELNVVDASACSPSLLAVIEEEGIEL